MAAGPAPPKPRRTRRARLLRLGAWTAGALVLAGTSCSLWIEHACTFDPPALPADHPAFALFATQETPTVRRCGPGWLFLDEGIRDLYLEGDPIARGRQMGELCRDALLEQEGALRVQLDQALPPGIKRFLVRKGVLFAYRDLQRYVAREDEIAVAALLPAGDPGPAPLDGVAPLYHRLLFYQTLYDTGQAMAESGLLEAEVGCTTFAASGAATAGGGLVVARNCDFEGGEVFDRCKVVHFVRPDAGQRHVTVSWGGLVGAISGVNESGLVVMLHAARTETTKWPRVGRPVPMILGAALLHDRTIEDVAKRFRESPSHAAAMVVVAETATGRSAVIETDPDRTVVVPSEDGVTVCANHLRDRAWDGDEVAERARRSGSSALRAGRMRELVAAARGRLDAATAVEFLRDGSGLGGIDVGLGNRTAISAMIAAHAVVWDGATRRLYVSRAPRGLGEHVAYDLGAFFDAPAGGAAPQPGSFRAGAPVPAVPGAAAIASAVADGRERVRASETALRSGDAAAALREADEAVRLLDRAPPALLARAEALTALGRADEARAAARLALGRQPVPGTEEQRLREIADE